MTEPVGALPGMMADLVGVGVKTVRDRRKALGLTWTLRPATVVSTDGLGNAVAVYDDPDDTTSLNMTDLVGNLAAGMRVMGMMVPPSGNYIIGRFGDRAEPMTYIDGASTATGVIGITTETTVLTLATFTFAAGRAYKIETRFDITSSNATNNALWRVRQTSIAGTILGAGVWALRSSAAGSNDVGSDLVVRNLTGADISSAVLLTLERTLIGTITLNANATQVAWMRLYDIGAASRFANAIQVV